MTREEAVNRFKGIRESFSISIAQSKFYSSKAELNELCDMAIEALSADAESRYAEWLEDIIVKAETFEWLCEDATDEEWCEKNCNYASIQAECLRHLYEVSEGGDERRAKNE